MYSLAFSIALVISLLVTLASTPALALDERVELNKASELTIAGPIELNIVQGDQNTLTFVGVSESDLEKVQLFQSNGKISLRSTGAPLKAEMILQSLSLLDVSGRATVSVNNFTLTEIEAKVFSDSKIAATGSCSALTARTNYFDGCTSPDQLVFDASQLVCEKVDFTLRGENCSAAIHATDDLIFSFRDNGVIVLHGSPKNMTRKGRTDLGELRQE